MSIVDCRVYRGLGTGSESTAENKELLDVCWTEEYREDVYWV